MLDTEKNMSAFKEGTLMELSPNVINIKYAIRDIVLLAKKVEKQGKKLYYFNIGDPDKFDFDTPDFLKQALVEAITKDNANYYSDSAGDPTLRNEIVKRQKRLWGTDLDPSKVLVTSGVSEAISFISASLKAGTEVLVSSPTYPPYLSYFNYHNVIPVEYNTQESENWQPDVEDIRRKISPKTQAIIIINPNNPTGAVYSQEVVKKIADLAGEHNLLLISDEIYDLLSFEKNFRSTASITDIPVLELNGISKTLLSPGWRLGWAVLRDENEIYSEFWEALAKQSRIRLCASSPMQVAVSKIINKEMDYLPAVVEKLKERADYFSKRINEMNGLSVVSPKGAFYAFPRINKDIDDRSFVLDLLKETGVLFVFGSGFGELGKGHFRSVVLPELPVMREALDHVESFLKAIN
ncbi:MAG: aminotransferase class I/II-fold pyridoxal phosphate-dependent enzyme [Candidatus Heimdallarchaeota archaeon]|nr:MAG: aminotransferase class I/II-fold pyridoxal phosphate-dependent enzyme [Candidatus Heimdallarchaeota archaeon]